MLLLRTSGHLESADLCRVAGDLESSLAERPAQLIVRQHADDPSLVYVECCRRDAVDRLLQGPLADIKFTEGPEPSRVVVLREGDVLELSLRGNIEVDATDDQRPWTHRFVYHSNLSSLSTELNAREVNRFAQNAFDSYHGYVQLRLVHRHYEPPPKLVTVVKHSSNNKKPTTTLGGKAVASDHDKNLVCEVMLLLPKVSH